MDQYRYPKTLPSGEPHPLADNYVYKVGKDQWIRPHTHGGVTILEDGSDEQKSLVQDFGYYNPAAVACVECYIERSLKPGVEPLFEIRAPDGTSIFTVKDIAWALGFAYEKPKEGGFVIQHLCGDGANTKCQCYILFTTPWGEPAQAATT